MRQILLLSGNTADEMVVVQDKIRLVEAGTGGSRSGVPINLLLSTTETSR